MTNINILKRSKADHEVNRNCCTENCCTVIPKSCTWTSRTASVEALCVKAYLAGFLDGDGSINAQIIRRPDYRLGFQIRVSITFFQSTKRHWFLLQIQKHHAPGGSLRRKDGISEYSLVGPQLVQRLCESLLPYLKVKRRQAALIIELTKRLKKNQSREDFLTLCEIVDQIGNLNDSKKRTSASDKRTISAIFVQSEWNKLLPVETSERVLALSMHTAQRDISSD